MQHPVDALASTDARVTEGRPRRRAVLRPASPCAARAWASAGATAAEQPAAAGGTARVGSAAPSPRCRRSCSRARRPQHRPTTRGRSWPPSPRPSPGSASTLERRTRWRVEGRRHRHARTPGAPPRSPPGRGTYRARTTVRRPHLARPARVTTAAVDTGVRGHLLRHRPRHHRLERPGPRARERLRAAHLRPHRPRRAPGRRRRPAPRRRPRPRPAGDAVRLHDRARRRRHEHLPAQQPGRDRAHPLLPARHRRRPHQAAAGQGHALRLLDAARRDEVRRRHHPPAAPRSTSWSSSARTAAVRETHRLAHVHYYEPGWQKVSLGDIFPDRPPVAGTRHERGGTSSTSSRSSGPPRSTSSASTAASTTARPRPCPRSPQYLVLSILTSDYELAELTAGRARRHRSGRLGPGLRRHVAAVDAQHPRSPGRTADGALLGSRHAPDACPRAAARRRRRRRRTPRLAGAARRRAALPARPPRRHQHPAPHGGGGPGARPGRRGAGPSSWLGRAAAGGGAHVGDRAARRRTRLARPARRGAGRPRPGGARRCGATWSACSTAGGCRTSRWPGGSPRSDVPAALDAIGHDESVLTVTTLRRWDPEAGIVHESVMIRSGHAPWPERATCR